MRTTIAFAFAAGSVAAVPAAAQDMALSVEIPRLRVAEYHNPYVAIWIEDEAGKHISTLDVWYDVDLQGEDGAKWLPDMRTWWRRAGRSMKMPANGISGPTQPPGRHAVQYKQGSRPLGNLAAGSYRLKVEAAREVGGRETVTIPFQWPPSGTQTGLASGKTELGAVRLTLKR
jgi:hypothetical protein